MCDPPTHILGRAESGRSSREPPLAHGALDRTTSFQFPSRVSRSTRARACMCTRAVAASQLLQCSFGSAAERGGRLTLASRRCGESARHWIRRRSRQSSSSPTRLVMPAMWRATSRFRERISMQRPRAAHTQTRSRVAPPYLTEHTGNVATDRHFVLERQTGNMGLKH
jgi:hypothetical protein